MSALADRVAEDIDRAVYELGVIASERGLLTERVSRAASLIRRIGEYRWVGIYDVGPEEISIITWSGPTAPTFPRFPVTQGLNGAAVRTGKAVIVGDVQSDPRYLTTFGTTRSEIVLPVYGPGSRAVVGTLDVESEATFAFDDGDASVLQRFANALAPLWSDQ